MMSPYLRFEQIAQRARISPTTLRYYIRLGLLPKSERTNAGRTEYPVSVLSRLSAITRAKRLGFTLREIKVFFSEQGWSNCLAETKLQMLDSQIAQLTQQRDALLEIRQACEGPQRCALISHIAEGERWEGK